MVISLSRRLDDFIFVLQAVCVVMSLFSQLLGVHGGSDEQYRTQLVS